jgi:hypothetical protein
VKSYALLSGNLVVNISIATEDWQPTPVWLDVTNQKCNVGDTYDESAGVFVSPQPWPSWALDANYNWQAPTPMPTDGQFYTWDEATLAWIEVAI